MAMRRIVLAALFLVGFTAPLRAQAPGTVSSATAPVAEAQGYTYNAEGRRDPFVSLMRRGSDPERSAASNRAPGLDGLGVGEVTLKGTMASRDGFVAILLGIDNRTYIARAGDRLLDGAIKTIASDGMVVMQRVNDPLSPRKQREIRKPLRQTEEAR
jgi:Tfp pilus assembly protein PilP